MNDLLQWLAIGLSIALTFGMALYVRRFEEARRDILRRLEDGK